MQTKIRLILFFAAFILVEKTLAQFPGWTYSGSLYILTTPEGANLSATVSETGFPLLVRLDKDFFTFSQAKANGEDIRFATMAGVALPYQLEEWDVANGKAAFWVRIPTITGNSRQGIKIFWGNASALSESNGASVFDLANGFEGVWHLNETGSTNTGAYKDATGNANNGTGTAMSSASTITGMVGRAQAFNGTSSFIDCGNKTSQRISGEVSASAWINLAGGEGQVLGSGGGWTDPGYSLFLLKNGPDYKIRIHQQRTGESGYIDNAFPSTNQWHLVGFSWSASDKIVRTYINGIQASQTFSFNGPLGMPLENTNIGRNQTHGFYFNGSIDEAVISSQARSAAWMKLVYENQKPMQTLVGPLVQSGTTFSVSQTQLTVLEGKVATLTATAGGAQKIYWILKDSAAGTILSVDRFNFNYLAGRVTSDKNVILQLKAVFPTEVKTQDITLTIKEDLPDPIFSLTAPTTWNGRDALTLTPVITNQTELTTKGVTTLTYAWDIANIAVTKTVTPGSLTLKRAEKNGTLTVSLSINNGGLNITRSVDITVTQPVSDPWLKRIPTADEKAENSQFYARNELNVCPVPYNGTLGSTADSVYVKIYAGAALQQRQALPLTAAKTYAFSPTLAPALVEYKLEFGSKAGGTETLVSTVTNLVCGDAYIVQGQSNAEATQFGTDDNTATSEFIRTYGSMGGDPGTGWHTAAHLGTGQVGYWGMEVARILMAKYSVPIFIINGAVGGTRIDLHQRNNSNPTDVLTIYGRLLSRIQGAKLTHGIKAVMWHQGENDQGNEAPTGKMDWETYQPYFLQMASDWKADFPNIKNYYIFQIWPAACGGMTAGSESLLREMQRSLPSFYSNMGIMSTLGVRPGSSCHYSAAGYQDFARLLTPLLERDFYGKISTISITPPNVVKAYFTSSAKLEVAVEFDQPVTWKTSLTSEFYLDGVQGKVTAGSVTGNVLTLTLNAASTATKITYLDSRSWSENNILYGANGIAALTFWNVPVYPEKNTVANITAPLHGKAEGDIAIHLNNGVVSITFGRREARPLTVEVVDLRGQTIVRKALTSTTGEAGRLTLSGLHRGVYLLKIKGVGRVAVLKKVTVF